MDLGLHRACQTTQVLCQSLEVVRWAAVCLWPQWDSLVSPSSSSVTSVVVSSLMRHCQYTSHSVCRNGRYRTTSCLGLSVDLALWSQKVLYKPIAWLGRAIRIHIHFCYCINNCYFSSHVKLIEVKQYEMVRYINVAHTSGTVTVRSVVARLASCSRQFYSRPWHCRVISETGDRLWQVN